MLKDRAQKTSALRLCISKRWLPQLEVDVEAARRTERSRYLLTDIDVLAVAPSPIGSHSKLVFDCKSGAGESAIHRAFWLSGVMTKTAASHGFVVLNPKVSITRDHRISAADLGVSLLHENEFEDLAQGIGGTTKPQEAVTSTIEAWERFFEIGKKYSKLIEYLTFTKANYWMAKDPGEQCRKLVAKLRAVSTELDPAKIEHLAIFADALCLFLLALSELANRLFLVLLRPNSHDEFSSALLALLYGGYLNVEAAQKIRRLTSGAAADETLAIFPELEKFEQLIREVLQAPLQALPASLLSRELGLSTLMAAGTSRLQTDLCKESPYAPKFVLMAAEYLQRATRLPPEFGTHFASAAMALSAGSLLVAV